MKQAHFPKCSVFCCWNDIFVWLCFVGYSLGTWKASEPREPRAKWKTAFGWGSRAEMADWWLGLVKGCASVLHEACDPAKLDCCVKFRVNIRLFVSGSFSQHELLALIFDVLQSCQQQQPWCFHCYIWGFVFDSQTETHTHFHLSSPLSCCTGGPSPTAWLQHGVPQWVTASKPHPPATAAVWHGTSTLFFLSPSTPPEVTAALHHTSSLTHPCPLPVSLVSH